MKKYFYVYDLENKEIVSGLYKTEAEAKTFLEKLVQTDDVETYLLSPICTHIIKECDHAIF